MANIVSDIPENERAKDTAIQLISRLPDQATWDDIIYEIYARQKIEEGLKASRESRTISHDDVKKRFSIE